MKSIREKEIFLIRHGSTEWSKQDRIQGATDLPLEPEGLLQARKLAGRLTREKVRRIFTSPLRRAAQTAQIIAESTNLKVQTDDRLRERSFGLWEGQSKKSHLTDLWDPKVVPRNGESVAHQSERVVEAILSIAKKAGSSIIVTHGGCIRAIMKYVLAGGKEKPLDYPGPCAITVLRFNGRRFEISKYNDDSHLCTPSSQ